MHYSTLLPLFSYDMVSCWVSVSPCSSPCVCIPPPFWCCGVFPPSFLLRACRCETRLRILFQVGFPLFGIFSWGREGVTCFVPVYCMKHLSGAWCGISGVFFLLTIFARLLTPPPSILHSTAHPNFSLLWCESLASTGARRWTTSSGTIEKDSRRRTSSFASTFAARPSST